MINIIDGHNFVWRMLSKDPNGTAPRSIYYNARPSDIFVWDGPHSIDRRRAIYPGYKVGRPRMTESIQATTDFVGELLLYSPATQILVPGYEADDVIAKVVRETPSQVRVNIVSSDQDFLQLTDRPNVTVECSRKTKVNAKYIPLYKTLVGDASDKIPGLPGFGEVSFDLLEHEEWDGFFDHTTFSEARLDRFTGLSGRHKSGIRTNFDLLLSYHKVVKFLAVPNSEINKNTIKGVPRPDIAEAKLKEFIL